MVCLMEAHSFGERAVRLVTAEVLQSAMGPQWKKQPNYAQSNERNFTK